MKLQIMQMSTNRSLPVWVGEVCLLSLFLTMEPVSSQYAGLQILNPRRSVVHEFVPPEYSSIKVFLTFTGVLPIRIPEYHVPSRRWVRDPGGLPNQQRSTS